jgi:hypothetical protein
MKKLILFLCVFFTYLTSFSQLTINQSVSPAGPYKVGDTLTVSYNVVRGTTKPRYVWLRYNYDNKALVMVPNSTSFGQGSSSQTFYTHWDNYLFTPKTNVADTQLYAQYQATPWGYAANADYNVGQLTVQRTDAFIDGVLATQKYVIKDKNTYTDIHKLSLAYAINDTSANISPITTSPGKFSLTNVTGNTSQFKVKVLFPQGYNITDHKVQLMPLKTDGSGDIDWSKQPIAQLSLDASGEATFTTQVKVGDSVGVFVSPASQKAWMNNIITVTDAYKAFLGHSQTDIAGTQNYFTYPVLEKKVGNITLNDNVFNESDAYYLFAHVMGVNVDDKAIIPKSTSTSWRWYSGLLNQSWLDGVVKNRVYITSPQQVVNAVFAWGGDLDWSHSSSTSAIASSITNNIFTNSVNGKTVSGIKSMSVGSLAYQQKVAEKVNLSVVSKLENGKVILNTTLTKEGLAGLQVIMNYDSTKLKLDNIVFNTGNTITNFSIDDNGRLSFGSIDQLKTARIKTGTPYSLIFTPKVQLTNTAGLFYFVLADAVLGNGEKVDLTID